MPTEKAPNNPLSQNYVPVGGTPYRVKTGDDWQSVARTAGVDVWALIEFNFKTRNPAEVNWYLRRNVGCRRATGDNKNWMFSSDAQPGIIYLPSSSRTPVSIQSIKFWLNAFIPRYIPGYTRPVPAGKHVGKTMIPGPQSTRVPTGIPFSTVDVGISDCYLTDQRVFSNDIRAKSRMHSEVKVNFGGTSPTITEFHNCDETTEIDCEDGTVEDTGRGDKSRMKFTLSSSVGSTKAVIKMECSASNPCAPTSRAVGDIDYNGRITVDAAGRSIEIDGMIDEFPAFEAYATINDGTGITVFQLLPTSGSTVMNLPGVANRTVKFRLEDRDGDGVFETLTKL